MENEILQQILVELKDLKHGQAGLVAGQAGLETRLGTLEAGQSALVAGQAGLETRLDSLEAGQAGLEARLDSLEAGQAGLETRLGTLEADIRDMKGTLEAVKDTSLRAELIEFKRIEAALDGIVVAIQKIELHEQRLSFLDDKVEQHSYEIAGLKAAR